MPSHRCQRWLVVILAVAACAPPPDNPDNLLYQLTPTENPGVVDAARITDGYQATRGDHWQTVVTSVFKSNDASVTYDLGSVVPIRGAYLQADNNDTLVLAVAGPDGSFHDVWTAGTHPSQGMQARHNGRLASEGRYVRLRFAGGDGFYSVSELQVFSRIGTWPPRLPSRKSVNPAIARQGPHRTAAILWTVLITLLVLVDRKTLPLPLRAAEGLVAGAVTVYALMTFADHWPAEYLTVQLVKALTAVVAAAALVRLSLWRRGADRRVLLGVLGCTAVLAVLAFYNLGVPQFWNAQAGRKDFVHTWDMRVYYPTVKYFDELGYDGLYWASTKAYLEDTGATYEQIARQPIRDLRDYRMTTVGESRLEIEAVKDNFSRERWQAFKRDMAYFRHSMAGGYLGSMRDHGANATPAWMVPAKLMFHFGHAGDGSLFLAALLDPLLLVLFFVAAVWAFGWPTALLCLVIFGTSSFPMHGSNWAGSTLRNDWMVFLGLALCLFKKEHWLLGGVLLGWAAMIRAFPVLGVAALALPTFWWLVARWRQQDAMPSLSVVLKARQPLLRSAAGVLIAVSVLGISSTALFGVEQGWMRWAAKISSHASKPNVNHVGLRAALTFDSGGGGDWLTRQRQLHQSRKPLIWGIALLFVAACVVACRELEHHQAVVAGMMLLPIVFYPSNYYLHFIFVLPMLHDDKARDGPNWRWAAVGLVLCAMSFMEYFSTSGISLHAKFTNWGVGLLIGWTLILGERAGFAITRAGWLKSSAQ